jgi:hypothetical protein
MNTSLDTCYRQTAARANWNDPTRDELVKSLNKAHSVNRTMIAVIEAMRRELLRERKWRKWLTVALALTWTALGFIVKLLLPYAVRGMVR